ncbi:MAG: regulatory protein TetR [Solirubrobacterales bacterium]|nr:regulatory protein TetR [Solirubrobacterales bacterium]
MTAAPTPKKRTRDPNRAAKVLAAARRLFYERGFHAVTVDEIGEAAGATGAALYRYFSSKEEVLSTLFDEAQDRMLVAIPDPTDDPIADVRTLVDRNLSITLEQRELGSIWAHEHRALSPEHTRRLDRRSRQFVDQWVACLRRAFPERADTDLYAAASAAIGTTTSLVARPGRVVSDHEQAIVRQMIVAGLLSLADPTPGA